jgi:hypothetical protein
MVSALKPAGTLRGKGTKVTNAHSGNDCDILVCRKCRQVLDPGRKDNILDTFGDFARLRCTNSTCGHADWYKLPAVIPRQNFSRPVAAEGSGEVWLHDVILGRSFRADGGMINEIAGEQQM